MTLKKIILSLVLVFLGATASAQIPEWGEKSLPRLNEQLRDTNTLLANGLKFETNFDAKMLEYVSDSTPGTETSVSHPLGRVPAGYVVYGQSAAGSVYDGSTAWTEQKIYLKSDAGSVTFKLIVF